MRRLQRLAALSAALVFAALSAAQAPAYDPNEGSLAASRPRIPEPMVFDLVRPLGAPRGELEVNSLFEQPVGGGTLGWAPEVEYTLFDGFGVEFEMPMSGARLMEYKFAVQDTWNGLSSDRLIQGWQAITRIGRSDGRLNLDLLHLAGVRLSDRWSGLTMNGVRRENDGFDRGAALLTNGSLFYAASKHRVYGVESNLKLGGPSSSRWLLMPQAHWKLFDDVNLQAGAGLERRARSKSHAVVGWRLIREF